MSSWHCHLLLLLLWWTALGNRGGKALTYEPTLFSCRQQRRSLPVQQFPVRLAGFSQAVGVKGATLPIMPSALDARQKGSAAEDAQAAVDLLQAIQALSSMPQLTSLNEMATDPMEARQARTKDSDGHQARCGNPLCALSCTSSDELDAWQVKPKLHLFQSADAVAKVHIGFLVLQ